MKLPSVYEPEKYESDIYSLWEKSDAFKAKDRGGDSYFSLVAPPPNANADLHMGYALTLAIEDALVRYHRMQGRATLFVPGADHAGFETWVVYEKLLNQAGKSRFDFSREQLYKQVWDFVQINKHNFENQMRALGASFDWEKFTFTLDNKVVETAYKTFKKMWDDGLIYRGNRIVNFCTFHGTSFSDIEVIHEEEKTKLWQIAYPLTDGSGEVVIATTRPETKLGQSALMVNPKDKRYKHLVGRTVNQPLVPGQPIPIIADEYVDMDFGTGVVTVTPGHDVNDFEVGAKHKLPVIDLITTEGKMSDNVPQPFRGLGLFQARDKVVKALEKSGYLKGVGDYTHSVGKCYRCGTVIEPLVREQWFVKMQPLAKPAIHALKTNKITFYPDSKKDQTVRYLTEVRDWNISRQIAWGIPIPAFVNTEDAGDWIYDTRVDQETITVGGKTYRRDPDVFDTWFSSGQWPYVTLNYPNGADFKNFYPLTLMETGGEILYQWVARMLMLGLYVTGEIPFKNVYIHGYVLAEDGAKMSKSLGNVINPQEAIKDYGSDGLRMGLLAGRRPGVNQGYHLAKIKGGRNFANKLWNIARFTEAQVGDTHALRASPKAESAADHWILDCLGDTSKGMAKAMEAYRISEAYELLYRFVWQDFADWYLEASKSQPNLPMLAYVLDSTLKLAHPFAPFVTETIWQTLAWEQGSILAVEPWPKVPKPDSKLVRQFEALITITTETRHICRALNVPKPALYFKDAPFLKEQAEIVKRLAGLSRVEEASAQKSGGLRLTQTKHQVWLDIDRAKAQAYLLKLKADRDTKRVILKRLQERLDNKKYMQQAPVTVVEETKAQLAEEKALLENLSQEIASFEKAAA